MSNAASDRTRARLALYGRVGFNLNLDSGPTGEDERLWGFDLTGGVNFELVLRARVTTQRAA